MHGRGESILTGSCSYKGSAFLKNIVGLSISWGDLTHLFFFMNAGLCFISGLLHFLSRQLILCGILFAQPQLGTPPPQSVCEVWKVERAWQGSLAAPGLTCHAEKQKLCPAARCLRLVQTFVAEVQSETYFCASNTV